MGGVKSPFRHLLLFILCSAALSGQPALDQVRQARALLGDDLWAQVIRVENTARHSVYPATTYALVFEFNGVLWFYTPYDGTQSLSLYLGRLAQDKADLAPLLREIERGFGRYVELPAAPASPLPAAGQLPNACFLESVAALREELAGGGVKRAALLAYYYGADGRHGHTVLTFETPAGLYVIDSARSPRPIALNRGLARDPLGLASEIHSSGRIVRARFLPIDLAASAPLIGESRRTRLSSAGAVYPKKV